MSTMWKWMLGILAIFAAGFFLARAMDGARATQVQRASDATIAALKLTVQPIHIGAVADSVDAARSDSAAAVAMRAANVERAARVAAQSTVAVLAQRLVVATSAGDSVPLLVATITTLAADTISLARELALVDAARRSDSTAYHEQLDVSLKLASIIAFDTAAIRALHDTVANVGRLPAPIPRPALHVAETIGIGAATLQACESHVLSIGCVAGLIVTGKRLWPHRSTP